MRMAIVKKNTSNKSWQHGEKGTILLCWWDCKLVQPLWKIIWGFVKKLKIELPFDPAILLLDICPKISKNTNSKKYMINVHAAAAKLLQSWLTRCDPIDDSPLGSFVHRIL